MKLRYARLRVALKALDAEPRAPRTQWFYELMTLALLRVVFGRPAEHIVLLVRAE